MKLLHILIAALGLVVIHPAHADDVAAQETPIQKHQAGSQQVAEEQDELSADVQQLILEQTQPKVIELLDQVEDIMDEATEWLLEADTGGRTIAAQTEIIEKIHAAAKQKQQQSGSKSGSAMMDMMERMMGKEPGQKPGQKPGQQPGQQSGEGQTGDSDTANTEQGGPAHQGDETRKVPKASGTTPQAMPDEFRGALDAYNRGAEQLVK
ncbi:MAG TPA: hypothetical protein VFY13_07280 [Luteolibacter sp.]|nr:hypothetical protein [Luteolibacter sp.]